MASVQEILVELYNIERDAEELSYMLANTGQDLQEDCKRIHSLINGSRTGLEATQTLTLATQTVLSAAASILGLSRKCKKFIADMEK